MRRQRHARLLSILVAAALLLAVVGGGQALAQGTPPAPVLPQSFWGSVKDASGNLILTGTVEAWMNGVKLDSIAIVDGQYGGPGGFDKRLVVSGTSDDVGKTIEFYVNRVKANETAKYAPGEKTRLDLTVAAPGDTTPPVVESTDPASGSANVAVDKAITVTFSEDVLAGGAYDGITLRDAAGGAVAVTKSIAGKVLTIRPNASLAYNTKYTVTIPAGAVQDLAGNALAQQYTFSFTTQAAPDITPPAVANTDPANNAPGVPVNKTISVTFSEDVQQGTAYDAISLKDANSAAVAVTKSIAGKVLTIKPNASLAYSTKYIVSIPAGAVKDLAGNALAQDYTFSFTTQAASGGGGGGGGGGGAPAPSADKVEKSIQAGATTVAEISGKVKVEVPAGAVTGANASIKAEVVGDEKASGAGMPLLSKVVEITLKNGTLTGRITVTLYFDKSKLGENEEPAAFFYDEKQSKWVRLEGTVDLDKGTMAVTVDHLTMFAVFAVAKEVQPSLPPPVVTFADMQGHWAADAVGKLAEKGIVTGYPDGTFKPERQVTRAEIAAILVRALELTPGTEQDLKFKDSAAIPAWARGAVAVAVREDLVKGYPQPDGMATFEANRSVTRAELAVLVARVLEKKLGELTPVELGFTDAAQIPAWAREGIGVALAKGLVTGYPDGTFRAERPVTRAEAAAMVARLLEATE